MRAAEVAELMGNRFKICFHAGVWGKLQHGFVQRAVGPLNSRAGSMGLEIATVVFDCF